jgi:hypothetical protein
MKKALGGDMNTTELYQPIRHINIHPDSQFRSDFILITSVLTAIVTMIAFCALAFWMSSPDQHRDCAQRVTQSLSPNQARLLIRSTPTYNNARSWCASHDDSDILINHATSWPLFPRQ